MGSTDGKQRYGPSDIARVFGRFLRVCGNQSIEKNSGVDKTNGGSIVDSIPVKDNGSSAVSLLANPDGITVHTDLRFGDHQMTVVFIDGHPYLIEQEVGRALGYCSKGKGIGRLFRDCRSRRLHEGLHYIFLSGRPLRYLDFMARNTMSFVLPKTPSVRLLSEEGVMAVANLTRKPAAFHFRQWVQHELMREVTREWRLSEELGEECVPEMGDVFDSAAEIAGIREFSDFTRVVVPSRPSQSMLD